MSEQPTPQPTPEPASDPGPTTTAALPAVTPAPAAPPTPPSGRYPAPIGWVIAAVILFWPTAIPALLASHRAARAAGAGDATASAHESATAKRWSIVSVCVGAALIVLSVVVSIVWAIVAAVAIHDARDDWRAHGPMRSDELPFGRQAPGGPDSEQDREQRQDRMEQRLDERRDRLRENQQPRGTAPRPTPSTGSDS